MYDSTQIARVVSNHAPVGTHSLYHVWDFRLFALFLRRFALVLHFFALVSLKTLPKLAPVRGYETRELDFCSNPTEMLESNWGGKKKLQRVILCIEPGGRHKFCYDGGSR